MTTNMEANMTTNMEAKDITTDMKDMDMDVTIESEDSPPKFSPENERQSLIEIIRWYLNKSEKTRGKTQKAKVVIDLFDFLALHVELVTKGDFGKFHIVVLQKIASFMNCSDSDLFPDGYLQKQFELFGGNDVLYKKDLDIIETERKNFDFGKVYYKVLRKDLKHHRYTYKVGINVDPVPFNPHGTCQSGGLYFSDKNSVSEFFNYGPKLAIVKIPEDAKVYKDSDKSWKADKLIIEEIVPISKSKLWEDYDFCYQVVQKDGDNIRYVLEQKEELCELAIQRNSGSIKYIYNQTDELCRKAVEEDGCLIKYVHNKTEELCKLAVEKSGYALQYIHNQTEELCELAVQSNPGAIQYVHNQTPKICEIAITKTINVLPYVHNKTETIRELVKQHWDKYLFRDDSDDESDNELDNECDVKAQEIVPQDVVVQKVREEVLKLSDKKCDEETEEVLNDE